MASAVTGKLYFGDNLDILKEFRDGFVDLIYLDPPFNSSESYNVLFKSHDKQQPNSQITAFEDTWHWNTTSEDVTSRLSEAEFHVTDQYRGTAQPVSGPKLLHFN